MGERRAVVPQSEFFLPGARDRIELRAFLFNKE